MTTKIVSLSLRPDVLTTLDAKRGDVSRSRAVEKYLCLCLKLPVRIEDKTEVVPE